MNKHIELVKKWLAGEDISVEVLWANSEAADIVAAAALSAAAGADAGAMLISGGHATYWVKEYEELTK